MLPGKTGAFKQDGEVVRELLKELAHAVRGLIGGGGRALLLQRLRKCKDGTVVRRVDVHGPAEVVDGLLKLAAFTFQDAREVPNHAVTGQQGPRTLQPVGGGLILLLTESEYAQIGPRSGLPRRLLCHFGQPSLGPKVFTHLNGDHARVERRHHILIR